MSIKTVFKCADEVVQRNAQSLEPLPQFNDIDPTRAQLSFAHERLMDAQSVRKGRLRNASRFARGAKFRQEVAVRG